MIKFKYKLTLNIWLNIFELPGSKKQIFLTQGDLNMARNCKTFKTEIRDRAAAALAALPKKSKSEMEMTGQELISSLTSQIKDAQSEGYTLDEIITTLKNSGVILGPSSLKIAIRAAARKHKPKRQTAPETAPTAKRAIEPATRVEMKNNKVLTAGARAALLDEH